MKTSRRSLLALTAAAVVLGLGGWLTGYGTVSAQTAVTPAADGNVANVACVLSPPNWTDCTVTLSQSIGEGGTIASTLPGNAARTIFCDDGYPLNSLCNVSGNTVVFTCPGGCGAGTQFEESVLGTYGVALAPQFELASNGIIQAATPRGLGALPFRGPDDRS